LIVTFEPRPGGRIYERTPGGREHDWGEVLAWEPPRRLVYLWHLRFDRADATEVEVTFTPVEGGTRVRIEHRGWERLGAVGPARPGGGGAAARSRGRPAPATAGAGPRSRSAPAT